MIYNIWRTSHILVRGHIKQKITRGRATDADGKPTNRVEERIRFRRRIHAKVEELKRVKEEHEEDIVGEVMA